MIKPRIVKDMSAFSLEVDEFLHNFYSQQTRICLHGRSWMPQADVYETENQYQVMMEAPGLAVEDIEILVDRLHVKVSGQRKKVSPREAFRVHHSEIALGCFSRTFRLPGPVDVSDAAADLENGLLTIVLKKEPKTITRVEIRN